MQWANNAERYGLIAQLLHWLVAGLIVLQFVFAELAELASDDGSMLGQLKWLARHKSFGITILLLALLRLGWRWRSPAPPLPAMPRWQSIGSRVSHVLLYGLLLAMPVTGWLRSSAANFSVSWFGLVRLPDLIAANRDAKYWLENIHETMATVLVVLAALHVAAALKHHFWDRDPVLVRMIPLSSSRSSRNS